MIPPFQPNGLLPAGRHQCTPTEFEQRYVTLFPDSLTRGNLFSGWMRRREQLSDLVTVEFEWIDGSYVTGKRDPSDIDVVTFIRQDVLEGLDPSHVQTLGTLVADGRSKLLYGCDSYLLPIFDLRHPAFTDEEHPHRKRYTRQRGYWDESWTRHGNIPDSKGYIEIRGDE